MKYFIIYLFAFVAFKSSGQTIIGIVTDQKEEMPFVPIKLIKNSYLIEKTTSDLYGKFQFKNVVLEISK